MTYIFIYRAGNMPLTEEQKKENRQVWDRWNAYLNENYGIRTWGGKIVSSESIEDYKGNIKGASIIEANSIEEAVEIAKKSPTVKYGGTVEVLEEFQR
jgi:hypothetical protein